VLTLNPDVWLDPLYIKSMVQVMDADEILGSAAGCLLRVEALGEEPQTVDSTGLFMRRSRRQYLRDDNQPATQRTQQSTPIFGPDGAAAFYRRAMLEDIRLMGEVFDSDFFMHKEDVDVSWRAQLRGWKSIYVPEAIAHHIRGFRPGQRGRVSPQMRFFGVRNRYLLMMKNEIPAHFFRDLWAIAAYDLAIFAYLLFKERQSLAALKSAWGLRHRMFAKRRIIQQQKRVDWKTLPPFFR
jgi:GT2 family glycosyltransferase